MGIKICTREAVAWSNGVDEVDAHDIRELVRVGDLSPPAQEGFYANGEDPYVNRKVRLNTIFK